MHSRRGFLSALGATACVLPFRSFAQKGGRRRVGFLGPLHSPLNGQRIAALRAGLIAQGLSEGVNFSIEFRGTDRGLERLRDLANALARSGVDVIVAHGTEETAAAKQATLSIPIVMAAAHDAAPLKLVASAMRPGGNVTGSSYSSPQMMQRRLELLRQAYIIPRNIAVLVNPMNPMTDATLTAMRATAKPLGVQLTPMEVRAPEAINGAFANMRRSNIKSYVISDDPVFMAGMSRMVDLSISRHLVGVGPGEFVEAGGPMSYAVNDLYAWGRTARFVARILRGAQPGDLPLEAASRFETVFSRRGAKMVGIAIPLEVSSRADRVIEASTASRAD